MGKSSKKLASKVDVAPTIVPTTKSEKKEKRETEVVVEKQKQKRVEGVKQAVLKQKTEVKTKKKKVETSNSSDESNSSDSEEEQKICVHPTKKVRQGLLAAIKGLLSECTCSLKESRMMLLECLFVLVCDDFEEISSAAQEFLEFLFSSRGKHHVDSEVAEIFNRLMEKLPKLVFGSDGLVALSYAQKLFVVIYYYGPRLVVDHLLQSPEIYSCGDLNKGNGCIMNGDCKIHYPQSFCSKSLQDLKAVKYLYKFIYNGHKLISPNDRGNTIDGIQRVQDTRLFMHKKQCGGLKAIKYLYKYIYKGHDRGNSIDEMQCLQDVRRFIQMKQIGEISN